MPLTKSAAICDVVTTYYDLAIVCRRTIALTACAATISLGNNAIVILRPHYRSPAKVRNI